MPQNAVYLLAIPGFADWERAHALAELGVLNEAIRQRWTAMFPSGRA